MNFLWSVTLAMVFYMICMAPMGFPWKTHVVFMEYHGIPWKYHMETMLFHGIYCGFLYESSMERNTCHGVVYDLHGTHGISMEYHQIHHAGFMQKYRLPHGFSMENLCSCYGVLWYSMDIPWKPCYSMEVTLGHHMNFPWCSTMAMVFHRIFMVTMVLPL